MKIRIYITLFVVCFVSQVALANSNESGKIIVEGNYKYIIGTLPDGTTKRLEVTEELATKFGALISAFDRVPYGLEFYIFLDGKLIQNGASEIYGAYYIGEQPWVLIGANPGGHNPNDLSFLKIHEDRSASEVTFEKPGIFVSYDQELDVKTEEKRLIVDLGLEDKKQKLAILENEKISVVYQELEYKPLSENECRKLYGFAEYHCSKKTWKLEVYCEEFASTLDKFIGTYPVTGQWVQEIKNQPGFNNEGFYQQCMSAYHAGNISAYDIFSKVVCGHKN